MYIKKMACASADETHFSERHDFSLPPSIWHIVKKMAHASIDETDSTEGPDFSLLPDIVWVKILIYLDLPARSKVSQTCHALYDAFHHPSVWHTVKIVYPKYSTDSQRVVTSKHYLQMAKRFGAYFRDLTIKTTVSNDKIPSDKKKVLLELAECCHLDELTLEVLYFGPMMKGSMPEEVELDLFVTIIRNAVCLKGFQLNEWPSSHSIKKEDVIEALKGNPKLKGLRKLSLFWQSSENTMWPTPKGTFSSPDTVLSTVRHFRNLQYLALRSNMLRQDILQEMAKPGHAALKRLSVLIIYSKSLQHVAIPDISSGTWKSLCTHCPELEVELIFLTRMRINDLAGFVKPEIPVASIGFMIYSCLRVEDLESISEKFSRTLKKFVSLVDVGDLDEPLKNLVKKSPNLTCLVYRGSLYHQTVLDLAAMKGRHWYRFEIPESAIKFSTPSTTQEWDDDAVVVQTADGEFQVAGMLRPSEQDEEELRKEKIKDFAAEVSQITDRKWRPLYSKLIPADDDGR